MKNNETLSNYYLHDFVNMLEREEIENKKANFQKKIEEELKKELTNLKCHNIS